MKKPTNFDRYLARQLRDPAFARRYRQAEEELNVALQLAAGPRSNGELPSVRPLRPRETLRN